MANSNNSPLSPISYTNRDFRSIFEELLDLTKKLTYKWDPTITNESDPGIILLKLNAIIGDKNNYNIDKNILEAFPETVTQEVSARNMYKQLAYIMPWYQSATTTVSFKWVGDDLEPGEMIKIPKFTMLTNSESSVVYTLIEDIYMTYAEPITSGKVIQGIVSDLMINGSTDLHLDNLDINNRIYLNDYNVAENGIFITNANESTSGFWEKVDNLQIEPLGKRYYEFGVSSRTNSTYVEFPTDIESLIKSGLNIKYILSDGLNGNVAAKQIIKFYEDVSIEFRGEKLNLNEDVIQLYNPSATIDGQDPEPVSEAYQSYKKVAGTFDTLVTLRDYINAIYQSGLVSNDIVSDRLTDIQSSYTIVTDSSGSSDKVIEYAKNQIDDDGNSKYDLSPYDLKLYLLHNGGIVDNITAYESSFDLERSGDDLELQVQNYIKSIRCMQHNFSSILNNIPCLFRNIYFLRIRFVPQYQLNSSQIASVKQNIMQALFKSLNSRELEFGEEADYNLIYDIIINSDERIKLVTIDDFNYTTYATYWDKDKSVFKSIPISEFNSPYIITRETKAELENVLTDREFKNPERYLYIDSKNYVYSYNERSGKLEEYATVYDATSEISFIDKFRIDIITKSILAGVTPLYKQNDSFTYSIDQKFNKIDTDISRVTTDLNISPWGYDEDGNPKKYDSKNPITTTKEYTLKENETLQFLAPSFISDVNYSNGTKFEFIMRDKTEVEQEYVLAKVDYFNTNNNEYNNSQTILYTWDNEKDFIVYWDFSKKGSQYPIQDDGTWPVINQDSNYKSNTGFYAKIPGETQSYYEKWRTNNNISVYTLKDIRRVDYNTDYKLKEGDSITFFWKESSEDEAPYLYRCYRGIKDETETDKSPIIKASFTLNATPPNEAKITSSNLLSSGQIPYNAIPNSDYSKIAEMWGDNALSGTKTLDIRRMNQVQLKSYENSYYFITNNITTITNEETNESTEMYQMKFSPTPKFKSNTYYNKDGNLIESEPTLWGVNTEDNSEAEAFYYDKEHTSKIHFNYEYTLNTDEYFIYTNKQLTQFELVGPGTYIELFNADFTNDEFTWQVETVAYEDVAMYGLESFINELKLMNIDGLVREQQVYNLTGGDSVSVTIEPKNYIEGETYPVFTTSESLPLPANKIKIQYKSEGMVGFEPLPGIDIADDSYSWVGKAILNLDTSWDTPQVLDNSISNSVNNSDNPYSGKYSKQQLIIPKGEDNQVYPADLSEDSKLYILSSSTLNKVGGENVDVTYLDALGERTNIDLFVYEKNEKFSNFPFQTLSNGSIRMQLADKDGNLPGINGEIDVNVSMETNYKYILGIQNSTPNGTFKFLYKLDEGDFTNVQCLNSPKNAEENEPYGRGKYYFLLDSTILKENGDNNPIIQLRFIIDQSDTQGYLEFDNLLKCVPNELFEKNYNISSDQIEAEIPILDYNGIFKYNVKVDDEIKIDDPLLAKNFFKEQHICNRYTIAQANLRMSDKYANDSAIMILNNR